ncbi:MAG TPA: hypothetical protein DEF41_14580 [Desulfovibrio sp.]|uniref:Uncharacterized protein n=1 Tax=Nitratidesulfovibrio vulgaris (strain ATCC 29579 / DSM 644 / CCUG 34227 / NCIMB 8303 / VKM B-1760 / Hildenborough) TaxID=882 RepID=Q729C0_NITV2|nr:hypothetical protein DVU_2431 [Nitratidesulfovibrio vulgaris str. Hildenborough]HBW17306.1 hypothetical protein [Desulfovibrio sp.]
MPQAARSVNRKSDVVLMMSESCSECGRPAVYPLLCLFVHMTLSFGQRLR